MMLQEPDKDELICEILLRESGRFAKFRERVVKNQVKGKILSIRNFGENLKLKTFIFSRWGFWVFVAFFATIFMSTSRRQTTESVTSFISYPIFFMNLKHP